MFPDPSIVKKSYIYTALVIYWLILLAATSLPTTSLPEVGGSDKVKHFSAYAVLTVLLTLSFLVQGRSTIFRKHAYVLSVLVAVFYGMLDEIHQAFIPGRNCEFWDWLADFGGSVTGSLIIYIFYVLDKKKKEKEAESGNH